MTALSQTTRRKLSLLQLAEEFGNVSKACRIMGFHRDTFYEVRRAFQMGGVGALVDKKRGPQSAHPNRVEPEVEEKILAYALEHPTHGQQRVANELRLQGLNVSPTGVRSVWMCHGLASRHQRLLQLEQQMQEDTYVLSEERMQGTNSELVDTAKALVAEFKPVKLGVEVVGGLEYLYADLARAAVGCPLQRLNPKSMGGTLQGKLGRAHYVRKYFEQGLVRIEDPASARAGTARLLVEMQAFPNASAQPGMDDCVDALVWAVLLASRPTARLGRAS